MKSLKIILLFLFIITSSSTINFLHAQPITNEQLDTLVQRAMKTFNVPGIAVSIIKDGKVVRSKGYGLRTLKDDKPADENTLFGIASCSKAFTAAALAILVDEGKLKWDDKLVTYLPEFKMYDPCTTAQFTIRDMLTHRSGLGLGAGDLLHNPDSSNFTIKDVIYALRYLKPEAGFRSRYAYDNIFYLVAGELISRVTGISWGDFIEQKIMQPLGMNNSGASYKRIKNNHDVIDGYYEVDSKLTPIVRADAETDAGAGGIYTSAADISKWMLLQLNGGKYGDGLSKQLFSDSVHKEMWTPQIFILASKYGAYNTHFGAYGLGWFLTDVKGYENVSHTGQDGGMISEISLIPDINFGITVLSNQEGGGAVRAIIDKVVDSYVGVNGIDRIKQWNDKVHANSQGSDSVLTSVWKVVKDAKTNMNGYQSDSNFTGTYKDNWFGDVKIYMQDKKLYFHSERSSQLTGQMHYYKKNMFVVRWNNPQMKADAFVLFTPNEQGKPNGFTMQRASPETSFAYDFQDLNFKKISR